LLSVVVKDAHVFDNRKPRRHSDPKFYTADKLDNVANNPDRAAARYLHGASGGGADTTELGIRAKSE
jgi:hypothetical protein